ncbi:MAG: sulfatase-like hydrolase/transferase, partial [Bacteroidota bacterium]
GFDYFFGYTSARKHYLHHDDALETAFLDSKNQHERKGQSLRQGHLWRNRQPVDTTAFSTQLFGEEARQFISRHQQTPFFLQLSFNAVHNFTHQLPESYLKEKGLKGYRDWDPAVEEYYDWYQQGRLPNNPEGRAHYLGQLHYLDQEIGALTRHLETLGLSANTMIIYIGDNGGSTPIYAMNQPLRGGKYMLYQGGIRVPLLIAMPDRFEGNRVLDNRVSGLDILPTICSVAGVDLPDYLDGFSLQPLLNNTQPELAHDTLYFDTGHERAILAGPWKYHEATDNRSAKYEMVELELGKFLRSLDQDVSESGNLLDDVDSDLNAQYRQRAGALEAALQRWQDGISEEVAAFAK